MPVPERYFGVWLQQVFVGVIKQRGSAVTFVVHPSYSRNPSRPVLGLAFEQDLEKRHTARLRLPAWFSNLLPEGALRRWISEQAGVLAIDEVDLLAEIGRDLPGAVTVLPLPGDAVPSVDEDGASQEQAQVSQIAPDERGRFSLAGVQLKLSMVATGDRLVVPLGGALGDWIVKFPDATFPNLPVVEFVSMELARRAGVDVPSIRLLSRDELPDTPDALWRSREGVAYAIERFDRGPARSLIHIEDFAQVRGVYPEHKYMGTAESLAALIHRGQDTDSLREAVRRLAFNILIDNSDAHLKNWSLLYADPRRPVLSPAYDLVSVAPYPTYGGRLALSLQGNTDPGAVRLAHFDRLGVRTGLGRGELEAAAETVTTQATNAWADIEDEYLSVFPEVRATVGQMIRTRALSLRGR